MEKTLASIPADINKFSNIESVKRLKQDLLEIKDNYKNSRIGQVLIPKQTLEDAIEYLEYLETEYNNSKESCKKQQENTKNG